MSKEAFEALVKQHGNKAQVLENMVQKGALAQSIRNQVFAEYKRLINKATVRPGATVYFGSKIGKHVHIAHNAVVRENTVLGDHTSIGCNTVVDPGSVIGNHSRIHSNCYIANTTIGEHCFIAPSVVFCDDPHPACPEYLNCVKGASVGNHVSIGANVTILPGVVIGDYAVIGAGSTVTKNVPAGEVWIGNPAKYHCLVQNLDCKSGIYRQAYEWKLKIK